MGTKKGQQRKTARRAYTPRKTYEDNAGRTTSLAEQKYGGGRIAYTIIGRKNLQTNKITIGYFKPRRFGGISVVSWSKKTGKAIWGGLNIRKK